MQPLKVPVERSKLQAAGVSDDVDDLDGTADDLDDEDLATIRADLKASIAEEQAGLYVDARQAIAHLRASR